jgi:hypothetical protein
MTSYFVIVKSNCPYYLTETLGQRTNRKVSVKLLYQCVDQATWITLICNLLRLRVGWGGNQKLKNWKYMPCCTIARPTDLVSSLTTRSRRRSSSRPHHLNSPAPPNPIPMDSLCWHHAKFGEEAQKCKEPCNGGKLPGRTLAVTGVASSNSSCLFHVRDTNTHAFSRWYRVCLTSLYRWPLTPTTQTCTYGHEQHSHRYVRITIAHPQPRWSLPRIFIIADVQKPILRADFLRHFGLLVDMKQCQLIDAATPTSRSRTFSLPTSLLVRPSVRSTLTTPTTVYCWSSQPSHKSAHLTALSCMTCHTPHWDHRPRSLTPSKTTGTRTSPCRKARVWARATARDHTSFIQRIVSSAHGAEEDCQRLVPLWGL